MPHTLGRLANSMAVECKRFITVDTDGKPMLDFLGENISRRYNAEDRQNLIGGINDCIAEQHQMAQAENDSKLLSRYERLAAYVESRSALWK